MSNAALQSELNSLERELNRVEQINYELKNELAAVVNGIVRANRELEEYNFKIRNDLERCNNSMNSSHQKVVDAIALQGEIEALYARFKQVELANKKIRECNNKKYYDFSNYRTVRKIVRGMLDNLDVQMVSDGTITKSVEAGHLQTPDYWLTCALISIMAWRNDDRELADRASARAVRLDKKNSAVFYMLFNLRMGREQAALKWFWTYQECELKGSDQRTFLMLFSLVSRTLSDNVDDNTKSEVSAFIKKVTDANMRAAGYSEDGIVSRIRKYFDKMKPSERIQYPVLGRCCGGFGQLNAVMMQAKNNVNILEFILKTSNVTIEQKNTFLKEYINELIDLPNKTEKEIYDEIEYNELVIRFEGDVKTAKERFAAEKSRRENDLDLIAEMIDWIYERDSQEVNSQIRLSMFTLTKALQEKAYEAYAEDYRSRRRNVYPVEIGEYAAEADFTREDEECGKIDEFYTEKKKNALSEIKAWPAYVGFGLAAVALVGCFFVGYWLAAAALAGAGYGVYKLLSNRSRARQINQRCEENIRSARDTMSKLFEEFRQYTKELDEYDSYYGRIKDEFAKI